MSADVHHVLTVTGFSDHSFDAATKQAIAGAWHNHGHEFESFESYEVLKMFGTIVTKDDKSPPEVHFASTVAISAIHGHDHNH